MKYFDYCEDEGNGSGNCWNLSNEDGTGYSVSNRYGWRDGEWDGSSSAKGPTNGGYEHGSGHGKGCFIGGMIINEPFTWGWGY